MNPLLLWLPVGLAAAGVAAWRLVVSRRRAADQAADRESAARTALLQARRAAGLPTGPEPAQPPVPAPASTPAAPARPPLARAPAMPTGVRPVPVPRPPEPGTEPRPSARTQAERIIAAEAERRQAALEKARNIAAAEARRAAQALERTEPLPPRTPAAEPVVAKAPPAPRVAYKTDAETLVLMVDDSKMVRVKTTRLLESHGFQVVTAVDGVDALAQLAARRPDLVITDVDMPNLDGFGLVGKLRADPATAGLPVVMITSAEERHRDPALALGVGLVLGKPYPEDALVAHIRAQRFVATGAPEAVPA
jgi:CheY-like chemotaxis protein